MKPVISIVIVTYNAAQHLRACLQNVSKQNISGCQLIIIDGGSVDGTLEIIQEFDELIDVWTSEPDKGIYDAMNKSIKYVKGDWVFFMGADDRLDDGFNQMLSDLKDADTIYYGMVNVNNVFYKDVYSSYRLAKLNICHQAIFYPAKVFEEYHYNLKYEIWADWFLNIQLWADPKYKFVYKSYLISTFGLQGISSVTKDYQFEANRYKIIYRYLGASATIRFFLRQLKRGIFNRQANIGT